MSGCSDQSLPCLSGTPSSSCSDTCVEDGIGVNVGTGMRGVTLLTSDAPDTFMEFVSPPRLCPLFRQGGHKADLSIDILTGYDLLCPRARQQVQNEVCRRRPRVIMLSPPCTVFSQMQHSNRGRCDPDRWASKEHDGFLLFDFAMELARMQVTANRFFCMEHPHGASSWKRESCLQVQGLPGVRLAVFDQCCFGMVTKITKTPVRKTTTLMSNLHSVAQVSTGRAFIIRMCTSA